MLISAFLLSNRKLKISRAGTKKKLLRERPSIGGLSGLQCMYKVGLAQWLLFGIFVQKVFKTNLNFRDQQVRNHKK